MRSQVKGNLFGILPVPFNSCFQTFVIFSDWLFPHEIVIFCKGITTSILLYNVCNVGFDRAGTLVFGIVDWAWVSGVTFVAEQVA